MDTTNPSVSVPEVRYAGFWLRVLAVIIDSIIINVGLAIIAGILFPGALAHSSGMMMYHYGRYGRGWQDGSPLHGANLVVGWFYFALMESSVWQATLGKRLLKIKVTDLAGRRITFLRATGRYFSKIISAIILCIGFLMAAFTARKQALHDMIAKTLVVKDIVA